MIKKVKQFRFFGDSNLIFNSNDQEQQTYHQMDDNQPDGLSSNDLMSGEIFKSFLPIIQLGVQTLPGVKFHLNTNLDPIIVGSSGIYELDLTDSSVKITYISFEQKSLELINNSPDGYLIIDIVYQEE